MFTYFAEGFGVQELCVEVEVTVLGSPSILFLTVSADVQQLLFEE